MATKPTKPASLGAGLVRKGAAAPASQAAAKPAKKPANDVDAGLAGGTYYKALTLKLDRRRYEALKMRGIREDKSSQELLTEALDALLAR
ncbi:hypothetical protein [Thiomonas intermedia]|uniref:hypothetical protein n=1 Tax=Thiomonas intermedia TaxID=926 RepID=UPI0012AB3DE8|nr:hypothetical protein [Thiomonas intermedia]